MSHGLGIMQRAMLFKLAQHEVRVAERAAERQRPYRSPDRWSLKELTYATAYEQVTARQRAEHEGWQKTLRRMKAGDKPAKERVAWMINICASLQKPGPNLDPEEFAPHWPDERLLLRFNPSRAILGLERRGYVLRDQYRRHDNLALTREGFAEARRLGGVPNSEIVDLDRVEANWRAPEDFLLGARNYVHVLPRDDDPPPGVRKIASPA